MKQTINFYLLALGLMLGQHTTFSQMSDAQTFKQYLSGTGKDHTVDWEFYCSAGSNSKQWTQIAVPSCWELQGFGHYNYGKDPFEERVNEYGLYKHRFEVPADWQNKVVKIVFEGVMTDAEVKVNGKLAGPIHQGAFYEFKYDITELLHFGAENVLEVKVNKASANTSINHAERQADFWIFGGIYRPVYLEVLPKQHISRVAIDAKADGRIHAAIFTQATSAKNIKLTLRHLDGTQLEALEVEAMDQSNGKWTVKTKASNIKTWDTENPNLYQLVIALQDNNEAALHTVTQRIGFRTVEVRDGDGIYVNGQPIKFKGINRHSFFPTSGRTTSKALSIEHALMIKDMNMNAVRMSHYPPDVHFLDVCDSLGLFVIDEVCTWHSPHLDTEVGRKLVKETVIRDVNHPSILLWANGNETGWNTELDDDYAIWDIQKREVIHPWNIFRKTNTMHYPRYHVFAYDAYAKDKIYFPTEFLHGLYDGGHGAGLEDYWQQMWDLPNGAGGFLWDFADEAVVRTDQDGRLDTDGNHAADGIVGPYGEKEASYFTIKAIWSPIYIADRYIREGFTGIFQVENRYHFTNLSECTMSAKWIQYGGVSDIKDPETLHQSEVLLPNLQPLEKGTFQVELPPNWRESDALHLTAWDKYGREIFTWTYPVRMPDEVNTDLIQRNTKGKLKTQQDENHVIVTGDDFQYTFSNETGILLEVINDKTEIPFRNGPIILDHKDQIETLTVTSGKQKTVIEVVYEMTDKSPGWASHKEYSSDIIRWTVYPDGLLDLHVEIKGKKIVDGFKGITFSYPESEVAGMKWLGDGPYRVWRNRMKGTRFQVWENDYNNTVTGESGFVYPEFKGYFSSLYWANVKGNHDNGFTVYCHSPHTFLRMLTPQPPSKDNKDRTTVNFPEGDISFLKNIPPIGTKFQDPETMGPQGHPENYFGNDDDPIVIKLTFEF